MPGHGHSYGLEDLCAGDGASSVVEVLSTERGVSTLILPRQGICGSQSLRPDTGSAQSCQNEGLA